jgi:peptidyl-prolyl cis-trans isomerase D
VSSKLTQFFGAFAVIAIAVVFILQFQPASQSQVAQTSGSKCAIEIQGDCISSAQWTASYRLIIQRVAPGADQDRLRSMGLYRRTSDGIVERWLLNKDAERLGITVSDDDLTASLAKGRAYVSLPAQEGLPQALVVPMNVENRQTKKFDRKAYEREVRTRTQLSEQEFREHQRRELIAERMRDLIRSRAHVSEPEAFAFYSREKSTSVVSYVKLDGRFYEDLVADRAQKAIDAWAQKNTELVEKSWEGRKAQFLPECRVSREVYLGHDGTDESKAEARKKADAALARLKKDESFEEVARSVSEAEDSKAKGGEMGCVGKDARLPKPVEEALFKLEEGKTSDVIETEGGYFIVRVEKIAKEAEAEKLGRAEVTRELYLKHEADRLSVEAAKQIHAAVRGGKTLDDALKAHLDELKAANQGDGGNDKNKKKGDKKAAGDKKAGDDKKAAAAKVEKTDDDKPKEGEASAPGVISFDNHPNRPVVETSLPFNMGGTPITGVASGQDVAKLAFELEKPGDVMGDVVPLERGYAVVQLKEKTPVSKEQWEKDRDGFLSGMRARKELDALINYMKRLRTAAEKEIKVKPEFQAEPKVKTDGEGSPLEEDPLGGE